MSRCLITGGRIVTAADDYRADILISGGRVSMIADAIPPEDGMQVHDASGLMVLPGGVDVHTHLETFIGPARTADTVDSATRAAAFGGTTTVIDFTRQPPGKSPVAGYGEWRGLAAKSCVDIGVHIILTDVKADMYEGMKELMDKEGVTSFKVFMIRTGPETIDDGQLQQIMETTAEHGALTCVHAENGPILARNIADNLAAENTHPKFHSLSRPNTVEGEATARAIRLSEMAEAPLYVVHVTAAEAVGAITEARDRGQTVYGETCPQYLFLTKDAYETPGFEAAKYVMSPPLRSEEDQEALWRALATGHLAVVSTDHCPFNFSAKTKGLEHSKELGLDSFTKIPNGAPGIETRIAMVYDGGVRQGRIGLNRFVELMATAPAKLFGLFPAKGTVAVGSDGDLALFDPKESWTVSAAGHHSDIDYSLFEGHRVTGRVKKVFLRGEMIVDGETWLGRPGMGEYLARGPSGMVV